MYPIRTLARPIRDFLLTRLEGLHIALHELAARLRESIASVIGTHVGTTVSEIIRASLNRRLPDEDDENPAEFHGERSSYGQHGYEERQPFWRDPEPMERWRGPEWNAPTLTSRSWAGWLPLVPPTLHSLAWLMEPLQARWPWLGTLGVGTATALVALLFNPLAGAITGSTGLALLLLRRADRTRVSREGTRSVFVR
jgi:hypothetical protein